MALNRWRVLSAQPGRIAFVVGLVAGGVCAAIALVAAAKSSAAFAAAGTPASGDALISATQVIPYSLALTWSSLAKGAGLGAAAGVGAAAAAAYLRRGTIPSVAVEADRPKDQNLWHYIVWPALACGLWAALHRGLSDAPPCGDEASYIHRGAELANAVRGFHLHALIEWWTSLGTRPLTGLLPTYLMSLFSVPLWALVAAQALLPAALLSYAAQRSAVVLGLGRGVALVALALVAMLPLWRFLTPLVLADAVQLGAAAVAMLHVLILLYDWRPKQALQAALWVAAVPTCKPGGIVWSVFPLVVVVFAAACVRVRRATPSERRTIAATFLDFAAVVGTLTPLLLIATGGPKVFSLISQHAIAIETLGFYDESVSTVAQKCLWALTALPRLASVPVLALATLGLGRAPRNVKWLALAGLILPLSIHAFAMESKSIRLLASGIAPLMLLSMLGISAFMARLSRPIVGQIAVIALVCCVLGRDLVQRVPDRANQGLLGPTPSARWRDWHWTWLGSHPVIQLGGGWPIARAQILKAISENCQPTASVALFMEPRLNDGIDSGYTTALLPQSFYVADAAMPTLDVFRNPRACLLTTSGPPLIWPDDHGRIHGESLNTAMVRAVALKQPPLDRFEAVAAITLPDGALISLHRTTGDATSLAQQLAWSDFLANSMPLAGIWTQFWLDLGRRAADAGQKDAACVQWARASAARPFRGLFPCEKYGPPSCLSVFDRRAARADAQRAGCPTLAGSVIWPQGVPNWIASAQDGSHE